MAKKKRSKVKSSGQTGKTSPSKRTIRQLPFLPFGTLIFVLVLFFDQYTKQVISTHYLVGQSHQVFSWLWYTYIQNTGMTWGLLRDNNGLLAWLAVIAFGCLLYYHDEFKTTIEKICYSLLLAGLWGNLLDRWLRGFVVDFIDLGWWPVFNIADSAISVAIVVFLLEQWRKSRMHPKKS